MTGTVPITPPPGRRQAGFTLVEALLSLTLTLMLGSLLLRLLVLESGASRRLLQTLTDRQLLERSRELIHHDRRQALAEAPDPTAATPACGLGGRTAVIHLETRHGPITYSLGDAPSPIWREPVLMRCGPSHGLDGSLQAGTPLNRVVADGLRPQDWPQPGS
jgi:hypothetical protein